MPAEQKRCGEKVRLVHVTSDGRHVTSAGRVKVKAAGQCRGWKEGAAVQGPRALDSAADSAAGSSLRVSLDAGWTRRGNWACHPMVQLLCCVEVAQCAGWCSGGGRAQSGLAAGAAWSILWPHQAMA